MIFNEYYSLNMSQYDNATIIKINIKYRDSWSPYKEIGIPMTADLNVRLYSLEMNMRFNEVHLIEHFIELNQKF